MINWFPGHMAKSLNQIKTYGNNANLVIIVLDARVPFLTINHVFDQVAPKTKRLFIFNKIDLCDLDKLNRLIKQNNFKDEYLKVSLKQSSSYKTILKKINFLIQKKQSKTIKTELNKIFVLGMPNTGKSTLINYLVKKSKLKTANKPGVTRKIQWIPIYPDLYILDSPGILMPKILDIETGYKLAVIGIIKYEILDIKDLVINFYIILSNQYPQFINALNIEIKFKASDVEKEIKKLCNIKKFFLLQNQLDYNRCYLYLFNYFKNLKKITID